MDNEQILMLKLKSIFLPRVHETVTRGTLDQLFCPPEIVKIPLATMFLKSQKKIAADAKNNVIRTDPVECLTFITCSRRISKYVHFFSLFMNSRIVQSVELFASS